MPDATFPKESLHESVRLADPQGRVTIAAVEADDVQADAVIALDRFVGEDVTYKDVIDGVRDELIAAAIRKNVSAVLPIGDELVGDMAVGAYEFVDDVLAGIKSYLYSDERMGSVDRVADMVITVGRGVFVNYMLDYGTLRAYFKDEISGEGAMKARRAQRAKPVRVGRPDVRDDRLARPPSAVALEWLGMLGEALVDVNSQSGFHRDSPMAPTTSRRQSFVAVFDSRTGRPVSMSDAGMLPDAKDLEHSQAAILVEYLEYNGGAQVRLSEEIAVRDGMMGEGVPELLQEVTRFRPILPFEKPSSSDRDDGLIMPDEKLDRANNAFASGLSSMDEGHKMTIQWTVSLPYRGGEALAEWLVTKMEDASLGEVRTLLTRRQFGYRLYDISVAPDGRFMGASLYRNHENSPRGTQYNVGIGLDPEGVARGIDFRTFRSEDGREIEVPVSFSWDGPKGAAHAAFLRWYESPQFKQARKSIIVEDDLSRVIFGRQPPRKRLDALMRYMKKAGDEFYESLKASYDELESEHNKGSFERFIDRRRKTLERERRIKPAEEVSIAFLEMLFRGILGDEKVDRIVRMRRSSPSKSGDSGGSGGGLSLAGDRMFNLTAPRTGPIELGAQAYVPKRDTLPGIGFGLSCDFSSNMGAGGEVMISPIISINPATR